MRFSLHGFFISFLQGLLTLIGVALVVFALYFGITSKNASEQIILSDEFLKYTNNLSFISYSSDEEAYADWKTIVDVDLFNGHLCLKWPYLGRSAHTNEKVSEMIIEAIPETATLIAGSLFIALFLGVQLGLLQARLKIKWLRRFFNLITSTALAMPSFVAAVILGWFFGYLLSSFTGLSTTGSLFTYDVYRGEEVLTLQNLFLPAWALSVRPMAVFANIIEDRMNEIYATNYIRTATANGLNARYILWRHAMPNALSSLLSSVGSWIVSLIIGGVFVEFIFGWKGLGHIIINAIKHNDFSVIMATTLVVSTTYILINFLLEFLYPVFDPTLRKG